MTVPSDTSAIFLVRLCFSRSPGRSALPPPDAVGGQCEEDHEGWQQHIIDPAEPVGKADSAKQNDERRREAAERGNDRAGNSGFQDGRVFQAVFLAGHASQRASRASPAVHPTSPMNAATARRSQARVREVLTKLAVVPHHC